jgi:hypothetical protein
LPLEWQSLALTLLLVASYWGRVWHPIFSLFFLPHLFHL